MHFFPRFRRLVCLGLTSLSTRVTLPSYNNNIVWQDFSETKKSKKCNSDPSQWSSSFNHSINLFKVNFSVKTSNGPLSRSRVLLSIPAGQSHWFDHCLIVYISITQPFWWDVGWSVSFHICWTRLWNQAQTHKPSQMFSWRSILKLLEQARELASKNCSSGDQFI